MFCLFLCIDCPKTIVSGARISKQRALFGLSGMSSGSIDNDTSVNFTHCAIITSYKTYLIVSFRLEEHDSRTCPNKKNPEFTAKCANCGGPHIASYWSCPNCLKIKSKVTEGKICTSVLKERKKPVDSNTKTPNQNVQLADTPKSPDTDLPSSEETVNCSLPQDLITNKEELADFFRLLKQIQIILAKVPDVKKTLEEVEKIEDPSNKLFILAQEHSDNI
ncbi:hypothetical protein AVEN_35151-1 [Araneus ventricosus]|uniref:Uncharacterized protein n=1 Tax=Araneus ventricosus TaxID=182803 RepID=A0A4Y2HC36_ARAVE|nr:hypothetical protein AVEN_35151-1 [Araneus ventricosus]